MDDPGIDSSGSQQVPNKQKTDLVEEMKAAEKILFDRDTRNYKLAEDILLRCVEANVRGALTTLGFHYVQSEKSAKVKQGYDMLVDAHDAGDVGASNKLGFVWGKGLLGTTDYEKAMKYYGIAANAGDCYAAFNLGSLFHNGLGVNIDYKKAREWFKTADLLGNEAAARPLAYINFALQTFEQEEALANALGRAYTPNIPNKEKAQSTYFDLIELIESDEAILQGLATTAMGMGVSINLHSSVHKALTLTHISQVRR